MRLFLYGTLLDPACLARHIGPGGGGVGVVLPDWRRVTLAGGRWPTLVRGRSPVAGGLPGLMIDVPAAGFARLNAYEGPRYALRRVVVRRGSRHSCAWAWIAPGGTRRTWP